MTNESDRTFDGTESSGADGTVRARYEWASTPPQIAVIETIAVALDRETTALEPLYEFVDPDALDALLRSNDSSATPNDITVTFSVADRQVTVHSSGDVIVRMDSFEL